jgi:hypothetical protein
MGNTETIWAKLELKTVYFGVELLFLSPPIKFNIFILFSKFFMADPSRSIFADMARTCNKCKPGDEPFSYSGDVSVSKC